MHRKYPCPHTLDASMCCECKDIPYNPKKKRVCQWCGDEAVAFSMSIDQVPNFACKFHTPNRGWHKLDCYDFSCSGCIEMEKHKKDITTSDTELPDLAAITSAYRRGHEVGEEEGRQQAVKECIAELEALIKLEHQEVAIAETVLERAIDLLSWKLTEDKK